MFTGLKGGRTVDGNDNFQILNDDQGHLLGGQDGAESLAKFHW